MMGEKVGKILLTFLRNVLDSTNSSQVGLRLKITLATKMKFLDFCVDNIIKWKKAPAGGISSSVSWACLMWIFQ
jgi:hypothetical protein